MKGNSLNRKLATVLSAACFISSGVVLKSTYDGVKNNTTIKRMKKRRMRNYKTDDVADFTAYRKKRLFK